LHISAEKIHAMMQSPGLLLVARILLTAAYWWGGFAKLYDFPSAIREVQHLGLEPAAVLAAATIVVEIGGSLFIIVGSSVWFAAAVLAGFTALATLVGHAFWTVSPEDRFREFNAFLEHVSLVGGFMFAAIASRGTVDAPYSNPPQGVDA
jgi:transmembrane protein